ncbi:hypothetical protein EV702DRAFT_1153319 [Suillus placidus]|uniref:Uncharacterized protein n=1 Tax=Suillus placidus TaxID=48579 RepID=A0A9P6ZG72_9AGAM|nr:hypothetical protein EV702DRAFT_1153319 [Suillus placidus]
MPASDADSEAHEDVDRLTLHGLADTPDIYIGYLPSFCAHLRDTRAHLAGSIPTPHSVTSTPPPQDNVPSSPEQIEEGTEPPPHQSKPTIWRSSLSSWSQSDVDAFFHALSIHSRWRPDLIAEAVKTKGELEIAEFLVTLDSCARSCATETGDIMSIAPAAIEVSDEWVVAEEAMAAALTVEEDHGELQEMEALRRKRVRDAKADRISRGKRRRVTVEVGAMACEDSERDDSEDESMSVDVIKGKARFEKWHARKIAAWERDDLLKKLEELHLQVLDAMLREDEEAQKKKSLSREGSSNVILQDLDNGLDTAILSPTSRRRHTKRLYMRRKRAQTRGEDMVPVTLARMKPGRKGKEMAAQAAEETEQDEMLPSGEEIGKRATMTPDFTEPDSEADDDDVGDAGKATTKKHINVGGKTRYQKIRSDFEKAGINASYLGEHGMDLFHLGRFGKLMGIYKSLEQCPEDDVGTFISPELIRYLQASVVAFTTDVIHRATVWKEQANELKGQKKVWRGKLHQINPLAVDYALKTIGVRTLSQQEHFSKLLEQYDLSPNKRKRKPKSSTPADVEDERASAAEHSPDTASYDIALSPHRAIYTPAFLAPASFNIGVVDTFFPGYDGQCQSKALINEDSCDAKEASLLSDETDEEALEDELREDEMLDEVDVETGKKVEEQLWAEVEREEGDDASVTSEQ